MKHTITTLTSKVTIDEGTTLEQIQREQPLFFRTAHGKRETFEVFRGCLIVRNTVKFSGCPAQRASAVYLYGPYEGEEHSSDVHAFTLFDVTLPTVRRMINAMIAAGVIPKSA